MKPLYTVRQIAQMAGVSEGAVRQLVRKGWLRPSLSLGDRYRRYSMEDWERALECSREEQIRLESAALGSSMAADESWTARAVQRLGR